MAVGSLLSLLKTPAMELGAEEDGAIAEAGSLYFLSERFALPGFITKYWDN